MHFSGGPMRFHPVIPVPIGFLALITVSLCAASASSVSLPVDQTLTPDGVQVSLPRLRPQVIALSPDGRLLITSGYTDELLVLDPATGAVRQTVHLAQEKPRVGPPGEDASFILLRDPGAQASYTGLVFSPDGTRLYLSDVNGSIKVFAVDRSGRVSALRSFTLPASGILHGRGKVQTAGDIPAGLAISSDGRRLYVALNLSNGLLEMDAATGAPLRRFEVGVAPYDVALCGSKGYVSNWGGRRPAADSPTGSAGSGTRVRVHPVRSIAVEGSVSVIDLARGRVCSEILTGRHASGLAASPGGRWVVVANAAEDTVSVIDTRGDSVAETIGLRWHAGDLFGASPNALAFDAKGRMLFVCNGTQNAVAVLSFQPGKSRLVGLIPVGWFPGAIAYDGSRRALYVANIKGEGREFSERPSTSDYSGPEGKFPVGLNSHNFIGSISLVPLPDAARLKTLTGEVLANYHRVVMETALLPARPGEPPRPVPERVGEPSVFKHVIYVIKENRTYDQVLGDMKEGNGEPAFCIFGESVTPNQHKIAREFVLLDNAYCAGILSADGHQWAMSAIATDYMEKSFAGFPRSYPFGGRSDATDALAYSPNGFIWDDALEHGRTVRNYGEFTIAHVRWKDLKRQKEPDYDDIYRDYMSHGGEISFSCEPILGSLAKISKLDTVGWPPTVSDQFRVDRFLDEFREFEKNGGLPALIILYLPCDHTIGTMPGVPTPAASEADNDLAMGRMVEALSRSVYWRDTCLIAIEDDPQSGWDHVSGYRTTAYVASAYTKRRGVVSERYTQPGLLRTIELILGLPPMNQLDAGAAPWVACFAGKGDFTPFTAVPNRVPLDQLNPRPEAIKNTALRQDALMSARLPFEEPDKCPEDVLNRILWRAQKGSQSPYPQWAVIAHPIDDD